MADEVNPFETVDVSIANDDESRLEDGVVEKKDPDASVDPYAGSLTQEERDEATAGLDSQIKLFDDAMARYAPETEEQRKKRERREKSQKIVAAISDGIQAVSNLWYTSQYAPNAYNHDKQSQLKSETARLDKLKAEREANADKYYNYAMQKGRAEHERAKTLRELEAQHEARRLARAEAARKEEAQGWARALQPDKAREQAGKANKAEQDAITAQNKAAVSTDLAQAEVDATRARGEASRASASASRAAAAASGRSNVAEFPAWDEKGNPHYFHTKDAADAFAKQHGTYQEEDVVEITESDSDTNGHTSSTKTKKGGHAARPNSTSGDGKKSTGVKW